MSCKNRDASREGDDPVVVLVGDSALMLSDVMQAMPHGINDEDSIRMMRSIIDSWLRRQVLISVAQRNLDDADEINQMVERYREDLILNRYLALMEGSDNHGVDKREIEMYYKLHRDSMLLEEPIIKGAFIKVRDSDPDLDQVRGWMQKGDSRSIDNLERYGLRSATQYAYFNDRWHPWHEVAGLVPYRFYDADAFLESTSDFETSYGGSVYILHISDYKGSGELMPEDYAKSEISEILRQNDISKRREELVSKLYSKAIEDGELKGGLYDPVTRRMGN